MAKTQVGERVGAILSADDNEVRLLGWGVYDGEHEPPFGPFGLSKAECDEVIAEMKADGTLREGVAFYTNPRITLDDGRVVWGAQCHWGPEEVVLKRIGSRRVVLVNVDGSAAVA